MFEFMNSNMQKMLAKIDFDKKLNVSVKADVLNDYLTAEIIEYRGMFIHTYFNDVIEKVDKEILQGAPEKDIENIMSKIHVLDLIIEKKYKPQKLLRVGLTIAKLLKYKLVAEFPDHCFIILVSYNIKGKYKDCIISFCQSKYFSLHCNIQCYLDNFKQEAVGIISN